MRLIWIIIPLILFSVIGIQNSFAEESITEKSNLVLDKILTYSTKNNNYDIHYNLPDGNLDRIAVRCGTATLSLYVTIEQPTQLIIEIPRNVMDWYSQDGDFLEDSLYVESERKIISHEKIVNKQSRIFLISIDDPKISTFTITGSIRTAVEKDFVNCLGNEYDRYLTDTLSPKKQFDNGIQTKDIHCYRDFTLMMKKSDNSPACVKPFSVSKLVERGWLKI